MKKGIVVGVMLPTAALVLSRLLICSLDSLFGLIGALARLDEATLSYGVQILAQFRTAKIISPWLPMLLIGAAAGLLASLLFRPRRKHPVLLGCIMLLLLLPVTLIALWFTEINGVRLGALLSAMLPMLPHLF